MILEQAVTPTRPVAAPAFANRPAQLRLTDIRKRLGPLQAVDGVSLDVAAGTIVTLLGPSGCGKSTTLRILSGLLRPDSGDIHLDGERITHLPPNRRRMTMMFQEYALFPHLSVGANVGYGLRMRGQRGPEAARRVAEMLELVGLDDAAAKYPHQLSGGQQQRVALARALAVDPEVLLLDEPLSNLDAKLRVRLRDEIVRVQKTLGKTMVFVTHDQEEALSISDRVAVMRAGRIAQLGSPADIYARPASRYVAEFVGLANFVAGIVIAPGLVRLKTGVIEVPGAVSTKAVTLMVRPESIRLGPPDAAAPGTLPGVIARTSFLGSAARYWVDTPVGELIVDDHAPAADPRSGAVSLTLATERVHVLPADEDA
jgi:ABC-type Fe3+/spermidine/putrescine transport system ATPase subunit